MSKKPRRIRTRLLKRLKNLRGSVKKTTKEVAGFVPTEPWEKKIKDGEKDE